MRSEISKLHRQLVSNIKVLDKDSLLICFKDGTEITQAMQRRQAA